MNYAIHGQGAILGSIAASVHQLGSVYEAQGKLAEAEEMYLKALYMLYSIHGQDAIHGDIAASLDLLGNFYEELGKMREAETFFAKGTPYDMFDLWSKLHT